MALLDTHVLIWWFEDQDRLPQNQQRVIQSASPQSPLFLSDISLWEVSMLHWLGRLEITLPLRDWLERAAAPPLVVRCGISPAIAAETTALPADFPRDPADRIIAATARLLRATLLTCDQRIVDAHAVPTLS